MQDQKKVSHWILSNTDLKTEETQKDEAIENGVSVDSFADFMPAEKSVQGNLNIYHIIINSVDAYREAT